MSKFQPGNEWHSISAPLEAPQNKFYLDGPFCYNVTETTILPKYETVSTDTCMIRNSDVRENNIPLKPGALC